MHDHAQDVDSALTEETAALTADRLPVGALAFVVVFGLAWVLEHRAHPDRDAIFALIYAAEIMVVVAGVWLTRWRVGRPHSRVIAVVMAIILCALVGVYNVLVRGEAEVMNMAFTYLLTGLMVLLPWGWRGQLPVAAAALVIFCAAASFGSRVLTSFGLNVLGLGAIGGLSVGGAAFLWRYRAMSLQQAAELRAANAALAEASRMKNEFLAAVSHELRTPLNIVVGYTDLLLEDNFGVLPPEAHEALKRVDRNGRTLVYLINDLLDLARIEAGRLTVNLQTVELAPVFAEMQRFAESRIDGKDIRFHASVPDTLAVTADRERLDEILVNLLSNAAKFTERGEIHLRAHAAHAGTVAIEVRDTGVGIDGAELSKIFQPFGQGVMGRKLGGVGIGLSLSQQLAQAMGGEISVRSELGRGATFTVRLPAASSL